MAEKITAAWIYADLERSVIDTDSRIAEDLAGKKTLPRTIEQLNRSTLLNEVIVFCPAQQLQDVSELVNGLQATVCPLTEPVSLSKRLKRRKWSLQSWRGGINEATLFDEFPLTREMIEFGRRQQFYTVLLTPAEAALASPELIDQIIDHNNKHDDEMRFTFSQAPPGLCGCLFRMDLAHELELAKTYIGDILAYNPDNAHADYIVQECAYKVGPELYSSQTRFIADNQRSYDLLYRFLRANNGNLIDTAKAVEAIEKMRMETAKLPPELEIEISTEPSLRYEGYPHRGFNNDNSQSARQHMSLEMFAKIVNDCRAYDDICITIGGFGEPLSHPDLPKMIKIAKAGGIFGINVETDGALLDDELTGILLDLPIDVVSVYLDADNAEFYRKIKGCDYFDRITDQMERFVEMSNEKEDGPILLPHMTKTRQTLDQMEGFYDRWKRTCQAAVLRGYNDYSGQIENQAVMDMSPPLRTQCDRIDSCMTIFANGDVPVCSQDYRGLNVIGNVNCNTVSEIWQSRQLQDVRDSHQRGQFDCNQLCSNCKEWYR